MNSHALKITEADAELIQQLLQLNNQTPIEQLTQFALQSPAFCDQMLSILFHRRRPPSITTPVIQQCVRQLGVDRARLLFVTSTIIKLFSEVVTPQFNKDLFWQDSLRRAFAAQMIAEELSYPNPYEAFVASFLSELGTLLLASRLQHISPILGKLRTRISVLRLQTEEVLTGKNHAEELSTTGLVSILPPRILQSIIEHHNPFPLNNRQAQLTCILNVADSIGDLAQTYPKKEAIKEAEEALILLMDFQQHPLSIESLFSAAETSANLLGQDLGLETSTTLDFSILSNMEELIELLNTDVFSEPPPVTLKSFESKHDFLQKLTLAQRQTTPYSLLLLNLDHFKQINVGFGFPTGDNLLAMLREKILRSMRSTDIILYLGKDEFLFLLPETSVTGGRIVGERIRALIKSVYLTIGMQRIGCTASIGGITINDPREQSFESLWPHVQDQLVQAKSKGRNRVNWQTSNK